MAVSPKDVINDGATIPDYCVNAAVPHLTRANVARHGKVKLVGDIYFYASHGLDESTQSVGGGTIVLKIIDMAATSEELASGLTILRDMIRDSWTASEEMERIREYCLSDWRQGWTLTACRRLRPSCHNIAAKNGNGDGRYVYQDNPLHAGDLHGQARVSSRGLLSFASAHP